MNKKELEYFKKKLIEEKEEIEKNLKQFEEELDFGDILNRPEEEADAIEEAIYYEGVKRSQEERLKQIKKALLRIKNNKYGICISCGGKIEKKVLEAYPESELCKSCKLKLTKKVKKQ
jgi:DnaK suppressor protein